MLRPMGPGKLYAILLQGIGYAAFFGAVQAIARLFDRLLPEGPCKRWLFRRIGD